MENDTWNSVLEVGCFEGVFTSKLAPHCRSLLACDVSRVACERAARRCAQFPQARIENCDVIRDKLSGDHDVIFAMDVLEMIHGRKRLHSVAAKLFSALRNGGLLVFSGCLLQREVKSAWWSKWFLEDGRNLVEFLAHSFPLRVVHTEVFPGPGRNVPEYNDHVIAIFKKF
jgi:2-polyprenyl-3-methyl-5-hydroxy-6-metoxy-1,4-benzoquinol methylase